jgi:hypothetical protein
MKNIYLDFNASTLEEIYFPHAYREYVPRLNSQEPFLLFGRLEEDLGVVPLHVQRVQVLRKFILPDRPSDMGSFFLRGTDENQRAAGVV